MWLILPGHSLSLREDRNLRQELKLRPWRNAVQGRLLSQLSYMTQDHLLGVASSTPHHQSPIKEMYHRLVYRPIL